MPIFEADWRVPGPGSIWNWFSFTFIIMPPADLMPFPTTYGSPPVPKNVIDAVIFIPPEWCSYL